MDWLTKDRRFLLIGIDSILATALFFGGARKGNSRMEHALICCQTDGIFISSSPRFGIHEQLHF
jgi:hypothetical protein